MPNTFYRENEYYLAHHGIIGMKWGKKNGPPYPLSDAKHDRIVKKAEKRREKILRDPKKLYKHANEFTKEEIDSAVAKFESINRVKSNIPKKPEKKVKLSMAQKRWAQNPTSLEKHFNRYTPEQFRLAQDILSNKQGLFDKKINQMNQPKKIMDTGIGYIDSVIKGITTFKNLKASFKNPAHSLPLDKQQQWNLYKKNKEAYNILYNRKAIRLSDININDIQTDELKKIMTALNNELGNR